AASRRAVERAARRRVPAARRTPQLDRVLSQASRGQDVEGDRRRAEAGRVDHRRGLRLSQGVDHPHWPYGRPHGRRAGRAAGARRGAAGVSVRVVVADRLTEAGLKLLAATPDVEVVNCAGKPRDELERALGAAHALIVRSETRVTADLLTHGPALRVIARAGTGVDNIDVHASTRRGIAVMNAPGANTVSAAEHAMGLLLAQTRHLINAARLTLMKPTAVLVNTARGELVDAVALAEAIEQKRIGGAALDVFAVEPLPADSPLRKLERVILTPHLAASTAEAQERVSLEICGAVRDALIAGDLSFAINVPGISGDLLRRLGPLLDLARRLARLALALVDGPVAAVEVDYGGRDEAAPRPVLMAAV